MAVERASPRSETAASPPALPKISMRSLSPELKKDGRIYIRSAILYRNEDIIVQSSKTTRRVHNTQTRTMRIGVESPQQPRFSEIPRGARSCPQEKREKSRAREHKKWSSSRYLHLITGVRLLHSRIRRICTFKNWLRVATKLRNKRLKSFRPMFSLSLSRTLRSCTTFSIPLLPLRSRGKCARARAYRCIYIRLYVERARGEPKLYSVLHTQPYKYNIRV